MKESKYVRISQTKMDVKWIHISFFLLPLCSGLFVSELYPFGTQYGDKLLQCYDQEDVSSQEIKLNTSVKFFSRKFDGIFVSTFPISPDNFLDLK